MRNDHVNSPLRARSLRPASAASLTHLCKSIEARLDVIAHLCTPTGQKDVRKSRTVSFQLVLALPDLGLSQSDFKALISIFQGEVIAVWTLLYATFGVCLLKLSILLPHLMVVVQSIRYLPRLLEYSKEDTFTFCDAVGVRDRLPVMHFLQWDVFKARLDCKFRDTPGGLVVLNGHFTLTNSGGDSQPITPDRWQSCVVSGITIQMAADVISDQELTTRSRHCPNPLCRRPVSGPSVARRETNCAACGIFFTMSEASDTWQVALDMSNTSEESILAARENSDGVENPVMHNPSTSLHDTNMIDHPPASWTFFRHFNLVANDASTLGARAGMMRVTYGNSHRYVRPTVHPRSGRVQEHLWTFFVHCSQEDVIEEVEMVLHPSFRNRHKRLRKPPFSTTHIGWGFFKIYAKIQLKKGWSWVDESGGRGSWSSPGLPNLSRSLSLGWTLVFGEGGGQSSMIRRITRQDPNQVEEVDLDDDTSREVLSGRTITDYRVAWQTVKRADRLESRFTEML